MSGIYLHIPFCKQACHYCDFHFSTSLQKKEVMIQMLIKELMHRKNEITDPIETIYFGGGTPSLLTSEEINELLYQIKGNFKLINQPEITLEANPDDLKKDKIKALYEGGINRLSIGVQSFFDEDLKQMNRAHNSKEVVQCLQDATSYFDNITLDLIYGIPEMDNEKWKSNIQKALAFPINHISSYALTVEPKTALKKMIENGSFQRPDDALAETHFHTLIDELERAEFVHYELSNFGKEGFFSKHNTSYWLGKPYLGIGPSAHSYNGNERSWNISNNAKYIKMMSNDELPITREVLSVNDRFNEYLMTGLRTIFGVSLPTIEATYGTHKKKNLLQNSQKFIDKGLLTIQNNNNEELLVTTRKGKFLCDGIASDLFEV